jgi:hypothetical protein
MTKKIKLVKDETATQLRGLAGYILWALEANGSGAATAILGNVGHDLRGMFAQLTGEPGAHLFSPRTRRYAEYAPAPADFEALVGAAADAAAELEAEVEADPEYTLGKRYARELHKALKKAAAQAALKRIWARAGLAAKNAAQQEGR